MPVLGMLATFTSLVASDAAFAQQTQGIGPVADTSTAQQAAAEPQQQTPQQPAASPLRIFGHFTQAVGYSDELPFAGIDGMTTDMRRLAVQLRYLTSTSGQAILQVKHVRDGHSALSGATPEFQLHWAYYRHRFDDLVVTAGRFPKAFGLFNETLTVGTVVPFYRVTQAFYPEGFDIIDGIGFDYDLDLGPFELDLEAYAGGSGFRTVVQTPAQPMVVDLHHDKTIGGRATVGLPSGPVEDLALSMSLLRYRDDTVEKWLTMKELALEAEHGPFGVRAEAVRADLGTTEVRGYYVQSQIDLMDRLDLVAQYESVDLKPEGPVASPALTYLRDRVIGLNYRANDHLVFKLEGHSASGYAFDTYVPLTEAAGKTRFAVASVSVSF